MVKCIDYDGIIEIENDNQREYLRNYIHLNDFFDLHWMFWVVLIGFFSYVFFKIIGIIDKIRVYRKVKSFYINDLNISKEDLKTISWENIVQRIFNKYNHVNFDIYNEREELQ